MIDCADDQFRRVLDALPYYVTLQDRDHKVLWSNILSRRDFGEPLGKTCDELYHLDRAKCSDCPVQQTFRDAKIHSAEMTFITKKRARINVLVHSAPVLDHGTTIVSVIQSAVDITHVKDIQKQLIMLGQTVAGMAHSIKNIMMGLEGGIYVVNKGIEAKDQEEVKDGWEMVLLNFDKISHIVKDILYCSKEREPSLLLIKPNDIAHEIYGLYRDVAASYNIQIKLDLDDNVKEAVIDPEGLHTVLANLVSNAMDACKIDLWKEEHLIEIRTRRGKDNSTIVEVADNGIGIDKTLKEHVFEDFFSSKGDKGTGLGLMVTQKILHEHGGSITFRSRPNRGTTFVARFPKRELSQDYNIHLLS